MALEFLRLGLGSKYGYGGSMHYMVTGSHKSTTPLTIYMGVANTFMNSYSTQGLGFFFRIEGAAKGMLIQVDSLQYGI